MDSHSALRVEELEINAQWICPTDRSRPIVDTTDPQWAEDTVGTTQKDIWIAPSPALQGPHPQACFLLSS